jgi:predicted transcriptional regulator
MSISFFIKIIRLSENEVCALILITRSQEPVHPSGLQRELGLLKGSISRIITGLQDIGLVERAGGETLLAGTPPAEASKRLYYSHRTSPLQEILSGQRVELLSRLGQSPRCLEAVAEETGISNDTVYDYLQGFLSLGIVSRSMQGKAHLYSFNCIIWPELKDFVTSLQECQVLRLVPREALLFKSLRPQDATFTSFSAYEDYYYYILPGKELSTQAYHEKGQMRGRF